MRSTHRDLWVTRLNEESHRRTCGYWYVVTEGNFSHTAFANREGLDRWMRERGLSPAGSLDEVPSSCRIQGEYRTEMHMEADALDGLQGEMTRTLSNGDYVTAIVTTDDDGIRTVHTLNPNVRTRTVYDYSESRKMMC